MTMQEHPLLSVRNLQTHFKVREGIVRAVDGVSFDVYPGQTVGIVGESGCGKSITMRSILRIVRKPGRIVDGEILYRAQSDDIKTDSDGYVDLTRLAPNSKAIRMVRGREIALIPQEPMVAFSPLHTVGDQMTEMIVLHKGVDKNAAREIAIDKLRLVGVPAPEKRIDMYSWELSGGLRQRAMIALALSCDPALLIADEPTTALDVTTQAQILNLLQRLQDELGMAIIMITHDLGVVAQVSDYVVVMYLGRVVEEGPVEDIFYSPKHPYTRALLNSIPSRHSEERSQLPSIRGSIPIPFNRPPGCPFHNRCDSFIRGVCDRNAPELKPVAGTNQAVSCFLYDEIAAASPAEVAQ
ncbi:MAG: ABC transporter ATP-binding protein [Anaerolineae bacterium]